MSIRRISCLAGGERSMNMRIISKKAIAMTMAAVLALCCAALACGVTNAKAVETVEGSSSTTTATTTTTTTTETEAVQQPPKPPAQPTLKVTKKGLTTMKFAITQKGKAAGFQVRYKVKGGTWKSKFTTKKTFKLKKVKINHGYYVKVRAYKLVDGKKLYGKFSKKKHVFNGVTPLKDSQITKMWYQKFIHGTKKAGQQRYIMLHDTEAEVAPANIVEGWKNDNGGYVAAHFVVGRDGKVVQTAKMSRILHHAGWGGPGNYDAKFGVGKNNGKGKGDDLKGQVAWYGYPSYGMNSHSIGIEMCHENGHNYTAAQLKSVDRLIALIDKTYGGYGGKIIAHNDWRPSNSDTDATFSKYLKNYKKYRRHAK